MKNRGLAVSTFAEEFVEEGGGVAGGALGDGFGRTCGEDGAAAATAVGAEVDEVIGALDDVEVAV